MIVAHFSFETNLYDNNKNACYQYRPYIKNSNRSSSSNVKMSNRNSFYSCMCVKSL